MTATPGTRPNPASLQTLWRHVGNGRPLLLAGYGLIIVDALAQISAPVVFREVLNRIEDDPRGFVHGGWMGPAGWAFVVAATFLIAAYLAHTFTRRGAARWANNLRRRLYEHVQLLSIDFFHRSRVGDLAGRMNQDIERLELTVWNGLAVVWACVILLLGIALMAWVDVWLAMLGLVLLGMATAWTLLFLPRLRRRHREVRDHLGTTSGTLAELLGVNPLIKAFTAEDMAQRRVTRDSARVLLHTESLARLQHRYVDAIGFHMGFVAPFVLLFAGAWRVGAGTLQIGDVVAVWAFWQRASGALTSILNNVPEVLSGMSAGERAAEIFAEEPAVPDRAGAPELSVTSGGILFEHVSFSYPARPGHLVLDDFHLQISAREQVALVGPSGAGKSTVVQLLMRFYDPLFGSIKIDDQDVRDVDQRSVRASIGMVFQENVFLSGTLARNLRLARPDASDDELRDALVAANAWDFVQSWEHGLETHVGERGVMLSGGQRQRLAIARVMLKDPAIVVLDEATSALDARSERLVLDALGRLTSGRTSLVIAHRIATVRNADRIVVLEGGRVASVGDHVSLLASSATYRAYCRDQSVA